MITIDKLKGLTKPSLPLRGRDNLTLKLVPDLAIDSVVEVLLDYFSESEKLKVIRVIFDDNERGYLARKDFLSSVKIGTRGWGSSEGASLPAGGPSTVKFVELCCSFAGCKKKFLVTSYDKSDPLFCDDHKTLMKPCNET